MEELITYLLQFGDLDARQRALIEAKATGKAIAKGAYFAEAGKVSSHIGYVTDGVFRVCYYDKTGDSFTRYFVYENRFVVDMNSFRDETPSAEYIEAITDCRLLVFSKKDFTDLSEQIPGWQDIFAKITSYVLENKLKFTGNMLVQDAQQRYLTFLAHYPRPGQPGAAQYAGLLSGYYALVAKPYPETYSLTAFLVIWQLWFAAVS